MARKSWKPNPRVLKRIEDKGKVNSMQIAAQEDEDTFFGNFIQIDHAAQLQLYATKGDSEDMWIVDSGATEHFCIQDIYSISQTFIDFRTGQEFAKITKQGRLRFFSLENSHDQGSALAATNADLGVDLNTLHQRFGHLHIEGVKELMIQNNIKLLNQ